MAVKTQVYGPIEVPDWVVDFDSFGEWRFSDDVPEKLKAHYVRGRVWIEDLEEIFSHNKVKVAITMALEAIAQNENLGMYFQDGMSSRWSAPVPWTRTTSISSRPTSTPAFANTGWSTPARPAKSNSRSTDARRRDSFRSAPRRGGPSRKSSIGRSASFAARSSAWRIM